MKNQATKQNVNKPETSKVVSILILYFMSIATILAGASFVVYSVLNDVSLRVLSSNIPGAIFGVLIAFLGTRYFLSVRALKSEVFKSTSKFSWSNFKKSEALKALSKSK